MLHDGAEDRRLDLLPVAAGLGDGDEVGAEHDAADIGDLEQALGERRLPGGVVVRHVERAGVEHGAAGQEFQRRRIGRCFGLNEHFSLLKRVQGPRLAQSYSINGRLAEPGQPRPNPSGTGVDILVAQVPGHDGHGIGKVPAVLANRLTSGPGPSSPLPAASTRMPMSASSSISLTISSGCAFADRALRRDLGDVLDAGGVFVEHLVCRLLRLRLHQVGDAKPLLVAVAGLDHAQHDDRRSWCGRRAWPPNRRRGRIPRCRR